MLFTYFKYFIGMWVQIKYISMILIFRMQWPVAFLPYTEGNGKREGDFQNQLVHVLFPQILEVFIYYYILIDVLTFENIQQFGMIDFWNFRFCMVLRTFQEDVTELEMSPLLIKGYKVY